MSLGKENIGEANSSKVREYLLAADNDKMLTLGYLRSLFNEKLWQDQDNKTIRFLIRNILIAAPHYPSVSKREPCTYKVAHFLIKMDQKNRKHIILDISTQMEVVMIKVGQDGSAIHRRRHKENPLKRAFAIN